VHVSRDDPAHLAIRRQHGRKRPPLVLRDHHHVERRDAGEKRRVVHGDDRRRVGLGRELLAEPRESIRRQ
jgi:hypothetical protein